MVIFLYVLWHVLELYVGACVYRRFSTGTGVCIYTHNDTLMYE